MRRLIWALAALLIVGGVVVALAFARTTTGVIRPVNYWQIDDVTLGVVATSAITIECGIAGVQESAETVRVSVECQKPVIGPSEGGAKIHVFEVRLESPLDGRRVLDGLGNPAGLCLHPGIDCQPPF